MHLIHHFIPSLIPRNATGIPKGNAFKLKRNICNNQQELAAPGVFRNQFLNLPTKFPFTDASHNCCSEHRGQIAAVFDVGLLCLLAKRDGGKFGIKCWGGLVMAT